MTGFERRKFIDYQNIKNIILIVVICTGGVSTSSSIQVEGSDSGMEQTNEYEGYASSPAGEQRFENDLVLQQTLKSQEQTLREQEREMKRFSRSKAFKNAYIYN